MAFGPDSAIDGVKLATEFVVELLRIDARRKATSWFGKGYWESGEGADGEFNVSADDL